ncbi:uncharacterized protein Z518_09475 [Rhinocladiella mackenziei CBS 650.93]|uniref:U6 snRNA phosphodiesterase n=1 Tax=Rhinocladiella mackenziei CBS 650.93 TaxID=1442369 RepID=A0A0D2GTT5_9EURO|nr:uncharacterized protein Z518_09475 [Rhinocladiella mackenziei CBS 650.93]KIX01748.1 hypothetical protein Z518_09475 [Rhinocladiella mackenziei CBS 650.93]
MLVDYSDSNSDSGEPAKDDQQNNRKRKAEDGEPTRLKSKQPPPLPTAFHSLYATNVRTSASDDPILHAGRTRQVPHVVGNWPTHVYLEWYPSKTELATLDDVIQNTSQVFDTSSHSLADSLHSCLRSDPGALLPLHISLSAPLVLRTEQRELFHQSLGQRLVRSHVKPFTVHITGLDWVANHDETRYFLVLKLSRPENNDLNKLLSLCNETAQEFELAQLYNDESIKSRQQMVDKTDAFHISIAWTLQEPDKQARGRVIDQEQDPLRALKVSFSLLKLKIGNTVADIPLAKGPKGLR